MQCLQARVSTSLLASYAILNLARDSAQLPLTNVNYHNFSPIKGFFFFFPVFFFFKHVHLWNMTCQSNGQCRGNKPVMEVTEEAAGFKVAWHRRNLIRQGLSYPRVTNVNLVGRTVCTLPDGLIDLIPMPFSCFYDPCLYSSPLSSQCLYLFCQVLSIS